MDRQDKATCRPDIYFSKEYAQLYCSDSSELFEFSYKEGESEFTNLAIKRLIVEVNSEQGAKPLFDLESPYGYGGYRTNDYDRAFIRRAMECYHEKAVSENIVCEFIRFHPYCTRPPVFETWLSFLTHDRDVVSLDLSLDDPTIRSQLKPKVRNILRKCDENLTFKFGSDINSFASLYRETMQRNDASEFYSFTPDYFHNIYELPGVELVEVLFEDKAISCGFFFFGNDLAHYHLSGNRYESRQYNGNYFLLEQVAEHARKLGCKKFMLGGGRTNASDDSLLIFKKKFSNESKRFYIGGKIFCEKAYERLVGDWRKRNPENSSSYFQCYRT